MSNQGDPRREKARGETWDEVLAGTSPTPERAFAKSGCLSPLGMLVALSVVLLLGAILVPNFLRARSRSQLTACKSNLKNIATALDMYSKDSGGQLPAGLDPLIPKYLARTPLCPAAQKPYVAHFGAKAPKNTLGKESYFYLECTGASHTHSGGRGNYPAFSSTEGLYENRP